MGGSNTFATDGTCFGFTPTTGKSSLKLVLFVFTRMKGHL